MLGFLGYSFMADQNSLNPNTVNIGNINKIILTNGKYDEFKIDNVILPYSTLNENWGYNTILLAKFKGNLKAGNVEFEALSVSKLRLKRRKIEDLSGWWTLYEVNYANESKTVFEFFDAMNESKQEYEYAIVPVFADGSEGVYINNKILSEFNGTWITDKDESYQLCYNLQYGTQNIVTKSGLFEPLGSKYPIRVRNAKTNYKKGSASATIVAQETYLNNNQIDSRKEIELRNKLESFITDGKSKILKDSNGNFWLITIDDDFKWDYDNNLLQKIASLSFSWTETGDSKSKNDMYENGLLDSIN